MIEPASNEQVKKIILSSPSSTSFLDPIPTPLLKECLDVLLPSITHIINRSLNEAEVPASFKMAIIIPLLKKETLDQNICTNYPVSTPRRSDVDIRWQSRRSVIHQIST